MPGQHTPIERQSSPALWGCIIFPPIFFAVFIAVVYFSKPIQMGWRYAVSVVAVARILGRIAD